MNSEQRVSRLTRKYKGQAFEFHSPFDHHPGWNEGDIGTLVRLCSKPQGDAVDPEIRDLWLARTAAGMTSHVWGGECFTPGSLEPVVEEHRFMNWAPRK